MTFWDFWQFLKLISSPIRNWDFGLLNFVLWNWTSIICEHKAYLQNNVGIRNINCNLYIIIHSQNYRLSHTKQTGNFRRHVNFFGCTINVVVHKSLVSEPQSVCSICTLEGKGVYKVYCLYTCGNVDIFGWPLN